MRIAVSRAPGVERVVTPLGLFFDLVYVFAIGQLSHHLLEHVDLRTGDETVIMALAVVYAWYMTAWGANWLNPDRLPVRVLLVGLMFASLLMSVAIPDAFDGRACLFVTGYLLLQAGRAASSARTGRYGPAGLSEERLTTAAPASLQHCRSAWDSLVLRTEASLRPFQARLARELPVRKRV